MPWTKNSDHLLKFEGTCRSKGWSCCPSSSSDHPRATRCTPLRYSWYRTSYPPKCRLHGSSSRLYLWPFPRTQPDGIFWRTDLWQGQKPWSNPFPLAIAVASGCLKGPESSGKTIYSSFTVDVWLIYVNLCHLFYPPPDKPDRVDAKSGRLNLYTVKNVCIL